MREAAGLTQVELAQASTVATRTVQRWENGETEKGAEVVRVLTALGVKLDPPAPDAVRALNSLGSEIRSALREMEAMLLRAREAEAAERESLSPRLEEVSALAAEGFARLEEDIAAVAQRLPPEELPAPAEAPQ